MSSDCVVLRDVSFSYDDGRPILDNINMQIKKGQLVAIMGGSGCGKTTLLRLIGGAIRPSKGTVTVDGQTVNALDQKALYALRRRMGMLFQFGALFTDLSVYENVAFPLREHTDLSEELIRDLVMLKLQAVGLRGVSHYLTRELSGGMARRVALARAIALDPMLMMYDEPFTGLDPISLAITGQLIKKFNHALGATSIMVTHDVAESFKLVDYVYFLAGGRIVAEGTTRDLQSTDNPHVRQFIAGEADGPVAFHVPAPPLSEVLLASLANQGGATP